MKQITCAQLGGPGTCGVVLLGSTSQEMIDAGWKHIEGSHPDLAKNIMSNPKEMNDAWMADFRTKFDALPEIE